MIAEDIKLSEILSQDPDTGLPMIGTQRVILAGVSAMGRLIEQLLTLVGQDNLVRVLSQFGYQVGMKGALEIASLYEFDSPIEWLRSLKYLGGMTGFADAQIEIHHFDSAFHSICLVE